MNIALPRLKSYTQLIILSLILVLTTACSGNSPKPLITYGDGSIAPRISNPSPSGVLSLNTTNVALSFNTDEAASCKFGNQANTLYADMEGTLGTNNQTQHQTSLSGLTQGTDYDYYIRCADLAGNTTDVDFVISFAIANLSDPFVTLTIREPANSVRDNEVVRTGVPFPKGLVQADDAIQLTASGSNTALPMQSRPLSLWDDSPLSVSQTTDFISIDTGPLQFSVPKNNGGIIHSATLTEAGETHFGGLLTSSSVPAANDPIKKYENYTADWDGDFNQYGLWDLSVTIEEQGDLHAVIRISGTHLDDAGIAYSSFAANVAGQASGYITRQNSETNISVVLKDMAENFPKGLAATANGIDIQLYPSAALALNLARYSSSIDGANGETTSITKNRSSQGVSKTDTFVIDFAAGNLNQTHTENIAQQVNAGPLLALADGDWYSDAKVMGVGDFSFNADKEISERHFHIDRKLKVLEDFMRFNQRKQFNWYGMLNYGDIRGYFKGGCAPGHSADCTWSEKGRYGWSGNSGEPSNQLWVQFLRNPSRDLFTDASTLAKHSQDLQMIHYGDATKHSDDSMSGGRNREFAVGSMHRHGVDAWSGYGQQPEYSHVAGIETYYYLTGDGRAKETLFEAAAFMTRYSIGTPSHTALVNGIDVLARATAVFHDQPTVFKRFNDRLEILVQDTFANDGVDNEIGDSSLGGSFGYFVRGAAGLMYHHELTGDSRSAALILDAADIISQGGDNWGVGNDGESGSVWYYLNNLTYAHSIADEYGRNKTPYYSLVSNVLAHNDHSSTQSGSDAISLASFEAIPTDWKNWVWDWDEGELDSAAPALLHITRQMTYRNDFMQDYHSYRAFVHLATAAALVAPE